MRKFKLNVDKESLSDQEISKRMDFDKFMQGIPQGQGSFLNGLNAAKGIMAVGVATAIVLGSYWLFHHPKDPSQPFINPPLKEAVIPTDSYIINSDRDTTIIYKTGSTVNIPAHAFMDKNGKPVDGPVEIRYREFHNLYEIILSGIPMTYDSAGNHFVFESAGMMEIGAFKNNEPLTIAPSTPLQVNLISNTSDDRFNLYSLDTTNRRWNYVSANTKENKSVIPIYDSSLARKYDEKISGMEEPVCPVKVHNPERCFTIDYDKKEFPELAIYQGVMFEVEKNDHSYSPNFAKKSWEDVDIQRKDQEHYTVTFSAKTESRSFEVIPVIEGKNYEEAQKEFALKMKDYETALHSRKSQDARREAILRESYEKYINQAKWDDVNTRVNNYMKKGIINYDFLAIRTFAIKNVGYWNCDYPTPVYVSGTSTGKNYIGRFAVNAVFLNQSKKPLEAKIVYLIEKKSNLLYTYVPLGNKVNDLKFDLDKDCMLMLVTKDGYPACLNAEDFKKAYSEKGESEFMMQVSSKKIETPEELQALFHM